MRAFYKQYTKLIGADKLFGNSTANIQLTNDGASALIKAKILSNKPLMIARLGANELNTILNYHFTNRNAFGKAYNLLKGIPYYNRYKRGIVENMNFVAGFFPPSTENLDQFSRMSLKDISEIDILGSWRAEEQFLFPFMKPNHSRVRLRDLTSFRQTTPWTEALANRKVLVVHPFEESIKSQYQIREKLFEDRRVLPKFELTTVKAVQSAGENDSGFPDWFSALDSMSDKIDKLDFDIALIACGSYGLSLAARIKRMGKQAIHVGGALQCLFGIKGTRWEGPPYEFDKLYYNEYWIRPSGSETPPSIDKVESGCYW